MKPQPQIFKLKPSIILRLVISIFCLVIYTNVKSVAIVLTSPFMYSENALYIINEDSINADFGDTVAVIQDGGDTIFVLSDSIDSIYSGRLIGTGDIIVSLTNNQYGIQKGTYGLNIADIFLPGHAPFSDNAEYLTDESPWDYLAKLAPQVLRYPGGSSSKFRHPFGSINPDNGTPYANLKNGGNGILLEDIITFYDMTDGSLDPTISPLIVYTDMTDGELDGTWLLSDQESNFEDFY